MSETVLAVIGDVHASWRRLALVLARIRERGAAGVLLVGDLGEPTPRFNGRENFANRVRYLASLERILGEVAATGLPYAWVPGNHDLPDAPGERNCDGRVHDVAGLRVYGIGGAGPERFGFPYEWDERDVRDRPEPECDVILSHCPPARTPLDRVPTSAQNVGSEAVRERAERHRGVLVCGHIHESPGSVQLGACLCLNAGGLGEPWGRAQVGFVEWRADGRHAVVHEDLESGSSRRWESSSQSL